MTNIYAHTHLQWKLSRNQPLHHVIILKFSEKRQKMKKKRDTMCAKLCSFFSVNSQISHEGGIGRFKSEAKNIGV